MKKVHVNGQEWQYNVGKKFINIISPVDPKTGHGKRHNVDIAVLKNTTWERIMDARELFSPCPSCGGRGCGYNDDERLLKLYNNPPLSFSDAWVSADDVRRYIQENIKP